MGAHALQRGRHTLGPPPLNTLPTARGRADDAPLTARAAAWMSAATCLDWNMSQSAWRVGGLRVTGWVGGLGGVRVVSSWVNCVGERGATAAGARPSARVRSSARPALARSHAGTTLTPHPPRPLNASPPPPPPPPHTHTHTPPTRQGEGGDEEAVEGAGGDVGDVGGGVCGVKVVRRASEGGVAPAVYVLCGWVGGRRGRAGGRAGSGACVWGGGRRVHAMQVRASGAARTPCAHPTHPTHPWSGTCS